MPRVTVRVQPRVKPKLVISSRKGSVLWEWQAGGDLQVPQGHVAQRRWVWMATTRHSIPPQGPAPAALSQGLLIHPSYSCNPVGAELVKAPGDGLGRESQHDNQI